MQNAPGKFYILVPGIIYTVFGVIGLVGALLAFAAASELVGSSITATSSPGATLSLITLFAASLAIVICAVETILGVTAIKYSGKPEKARVVIVTGYVLMILQTITFIVGVISILVVGDSLSSALPSVGSLIIGLILPALFIVGGRKNRQSALNPTVIEET